MGIKAEEVKDRRMHIGHVMGMFDGVKTKFICAAMDGSTFDSAPRHPHTETIGMMVSAITALGARRAAKLGRENDKRLVQQSPLFQILQQTGNRLINLLSEV